MRTYKKSKPNQVNQKDLVSLIAAKTGYLKYEIEDVLEGFRYVVTDALINDKEVCLQHLFTVKQKKIPPRNMSRNLAGKENREYYTSKGSIGMTLKMSGFMKNALNGVYDDLKPRSEDEDSEE